MTDYIVRKNKKDSKKPFCVVLKKGKAKEGQKFSANDLLCPDQQLESLLAQDPCKIEEVKKDVKLKAKDEAKREAVKKDRAEKAEKAKNKDKNK